MSFRSAAVSDIKRDFLLYDGECPVCRRVVAWTRMKTARPNMVLLDARYEPDLVKYFRGMGLEINDGIVLSIDGKVHYGAEAMALLARLGEPDAAARLILAPFAHERVSRWSYPGLVSLRKLLLFLIGRKRI
jgi:predicted DCC family thiol-disulfide oxidoreductase YuxK